MNKKIFFSLVAAAALVAPATVRGQDAATSANAHGQAQSQARAPQARIDAAMQAAARARIPAALLESKVAEGEAKNVPQERIASAVEVRLQGLLRASEALKRADVEVASQSELAVTADALEAGVSENAVIKVSRAAPAERRAVAVATLTGLVQLGHASDRALERVTAAVRSNAALSNLHAEVSSQLQLGGGRANAAGNGLIRIK